MKDTIKTILRENLLTNSLGILVTKPKQELIIMIGIPGSGKSTKAKELVGDGIIHSTDDVIESIGDYKILFKNMITSGDFTALVTAHNNNFKNATSSMDKGISPVIIDNTNLTPSEPKRYIEYALNIGYSDSNIKFIDIGTAGLSPEELTNRNTHGVPLDKIKSMIQKYNAFKPITLQKVLDTKSINSEKQSKFASLVLDKPSRDKLLNEVYNYIPNGWDVILHHMTINFGKGLPKELIDDLGQIKIIIANEIGISEKAMAVKVSGYYSDNKIPHITIAINPNGGKAVMSNDITDWNRLETPITLYGIITEEKLG
jgi:predicted kinase